MRILAVDSRAQALEETAALVGELQPEAELLCSGSSLEALGVARKTEIDTAVRRVEPPEVGGVDRGRYRVELDPLVNLIFE